MTRVHFDIETRSRVNLTSSGQYVYALDRSTEIILSAWAIDDGPISVWNMLDDLPPAELEDAFLDPAVVLCAHNSGFERILMTLAGPRQSRTIPASVIKAIKPRERWNCTAARAAALGLPRSLDRAAKALRLPVGKDLEGGKLMMKMCRPRALDEKAMPLWHEMPEHIKRLGEYCIVDVETERAIDNAVPELSAIERDYWLLIERMNDRGAPVDEDLVKRVILMVGEAEILLNRKLNFVTSGAVPKVTNTKKIATWLQEQGIENPLADAEKFSVGKAAINAWMEDESLPPLVREVLTLRREGGKSSTAKFRAILDRINADSRLRGSLVYCGAGSTGRLASRGAQLHNLARGGTVKFIEAAIDAVLDDMPLSVIEEAFGPPLVVASEMLRPSFKAPEGFWVARGDYAQIELRCNGHVSNEHKVLDAFRAYDKKEGPDIYLVAAGDIAGRDPRTIDKEDPLRQTGKVLELSLGFGGGKGALIAMAKLYNIILSEEKAADLVTKWRAARLATTGMWKTLENAAMACMMAPPGQRFPAGEHLSFRRSRRALTLRLPSGRSLFYWYPERALLPMPWNDRDGNPAFKEGITYVAEDSQTHLWKRFPLSRMILIENPVQAIARDLMMDALLKLENQGFNPFLSVHDEAICLLPKSKYPTAKEAARAVKEVMEDTPAWAAGLPVTADASAADRYLKG